MKRRYFLAFFTTFLLSAGVFSLKAASSRGVGKARLALLTRGVNLSHWFAQTRLIPENFQNRITTEDIKRIREMGFRHVRLPVDPDILFDKEKPESLNKENLKYFDAAVDKILAQNLALIVDCHPTSGFKQRLYRDASFAKDFARFWRTLAEHLGRRSPEKVFLEVLNEPDTEDPQEWYDLQRPLLAAMRAGAPEHTLIASANQRVGDDWSPIRALEMLTPVDDPNVVYNFHYYKPKQFTHQGATWGWDLLQYFRDVPYPSSLEAVAPLISKIDNVAARRSLQYYGEQTWNADKIEAQISRAAAWAKAHQVCVTCNEFGVYRQAAPAEDRAAWLRDVRSVLEQHQIGWAMWDYKGGFGATIEVNGDLVPDKRVLSALFQDNSS
ncbi:cellulase family glycosylhydrolase [Lyngbya aestuarii]|uniref:cellulase family glycosylhydrolase n=1 Tax=Lyngbya aestuarii TaxID=118322 RepID=UPI00403D65F0